MVIISEKININVRSHKKCYFKQINPSIVMMAHNSVQIASIQAIPYFLGLGERGREKKKKNSPNSEYMDIFLFL